MDEVHKKKKKSPHFYVQSTFLYFFGVVIADNRLRKVQKHVLRDFKENKPQSGKKAPKKILKVPQNCGKSS
jgi:hypothetical protein